MTRSEVIEIHDALKRSLRELTRIKEIQTGRDTHPLWDDSAKPMSVHVASTVETVEGLMRQLADTLLNYAIDQED